MALADGAVGQVVTISQSFTGATLPSSWNYGGNVNNNGTITPFSPTASGTSAGMTMTTSSGNESTYAYDPTSFSSANATIAAKFTYTASNGSAPAADGITFFLADAGVVAGSGFSPGAFGGSLGYAQKDANAAPPNGVSGLNGGYLGVGIDEYGNYSNPTEGRIGGPGQEANNVAVRGPGSGQNGYNYLGGTTGGLPNFSAPTTGSVSTNFEMTLSATNQLIMYMQENGTYTPIFTADLSNYTRPSNLILGFTGSTGGDNSTQQIANVLLTSVTANLWTNYGGDSKWGTTNNWFGNPTNAPGSAASAGNPSDVLLNNAYVSSAQTISLNGNTQTLRALDFDAPFSYTVGSAPGDGTIVFNDEGVLGPSGIYVTHTNGTATQTVNSNLAANNAINVENDSSSALNLNGNFDTKGNTITFNGSGNVNLAGVVSNSTGSGSLVQSGAGTTTLSGANTYSGGTTLNAGTLKADNNSALGSGGLTINGGTLSSDSNNTVNNAITLNASAGLNNITTGGTLTQNGGSYTLTMDGATQSGAVKLSNNNTARTLTINVDAGSSSAISGVIQNGGTGAGSLTKTGAGTLTLSGANTYSGTTSVNAGTLQLGASNVLSTASNLTLGGGTLNLNQNSNKVNNLTVSSSSTLDFGSGSTGNSFVFNGLTLASPNILTINNYNGPDSSNFNGSGDFIGTLSNNLATSKLNQIYFSGFGTGSLENNGNLTDAGNNLGLAYRICPTAIDWGPYTWTSNGNQYWDTGGNWQGGNRPNGTNNVYVDFGKGTQTAVAFNGYNTINALRFDSNAPGYTITNSGGTNHHLVLDNNGLLSFVQQQSANSQTLSPHWLQLNSSTVFDITGAGDLTVGALIIDGNNGAASITKTGSGGKLILTGANTYSGGTSIQNGTIQIQNTSGLGSGAVTVASGATLELSNTGGTVANAFTVNGSGVSSNGAIDNVAGNNTLSRAVALGSDSRINSDAGTLTLSGGVTGTNANLSLGGTGNINVSSAIATGAGGVTKDGSGTVTFSGANTYTGTTTVNSGTLNLSGTSPTVNGDLTVNGGTVNDTTGSQLATTSNVTMTGGTLALGAQTETINSLTGSSGSTISSTGGGSLTINGTGVSSFAGTLSGSGALVNGSTGTIDLSGTSSTFSGTITVNSGIVNASANNAAGGASATTSVGGTGNFQVQGGVALANNFNLSTDGSSSGNGAIENISGNNNVAGAVTLGANSRVQSDSGTLTFSNTVGLGTHTLNVGGNSDTAITGVISGTGGLTKDGSGTLTLSGANTFTGATTVSAGTLAAGAQNVLNTTSGVAVSNGATLGLNNFNQTIANLNSSGALDFGATGGETLTLTGTNTLAGTMAGATGTLVVGSGATLTLGANFTDPNLTIVLAGGTLNLNGTTGTFGNLQITGNSVLDFSGTANSLLTVNNVSFQNTGLQLSVTNWADTMDYFYSTNQSPSTQGSAPLNQIVFTGFTGANTKWLSYDHEITPVPEPSTYGAIFTALSLGLLALRRRKLQIRKF